MLLGRGPALTELEDNVLLENFIEDVCKKREGSPIFKPLGYTESRTIKTMKQIFLTARICSISGITKQNKSPLPKKGDLRHILNVVSK